MRTTKRRIVRWGVALAFCVVLGAAASADLVSIPTGTDFTITMQNDNYVPHDDCEGGLTPGGTDLMAITYLAPSNDWSSDILGALWGQYGSYESGGETIWWNYETAGDNLGGTLTIDWYKAFDNEIGSICLHGAEIVAYYDLGADDPDGLDWIQVYVESGGAVHTPGYTVDGTGDDNPAYYAPGWGPWFPGGYTPGTHDMTWSDRPQDPHPEADPWAGSVEFYLFLADYGDVYDSGGASMRDITIYDGFRWGYVGECIVPEPSTILLLALGGFGLLIRRRMF
ncbi:MAG TPA: PEP-CTERM sorting domain-containing protein [Candidatus Hydrogenedentes bacterium]|nr:PEP-CTERM sorting domain-containing protein [Candidatus Hydrogenedentota bacterium]